jgi:hypothetical protein
MAEQSEQFSPFEKCRYRGIQAGILGARAAAVRGHLCKEMIGWDGDRTLCRLFQAKLQAVLGDSDILSKRAQAQFNKACIGVIE